MAGVLRSLLAYPGQVIDTDAIRIGDGTAALPALRRAGGTGNSGLYFSGSSIVFSVAGTGRWFIDEVDGALKPIQGTNILNIGSAALRPLKIFVGTNGIDSTGPFVVTSVGPHAFGGPSLASQEVLVTGSFSPAAGSPVALGINSTLNPVAGANALGLQIAPTLNKAGSGTHPDFVGLMLEVPAIGAAAAALTNATTLKIAGAPAIGTTQRSIWVVGGLSQFDGDVRISGNVGFYSTIPTAKQTATGARGGNAALASLLTALAAVGLITDSTTA